MPGLRMQVSECKTNEGARNRQAEVRRGDFLETCLEVFWKSTWKRAQASMRDIAQASTAGLRRGCLLHRSGWSQFPLLGEHPAPLRVQRGEGRGCEMGAELGQPADQRQFRIF